MNPPFILDQDSYTVPAQGLQLAHDTILHRYCVSIQMAQRTVPGDNIRKMLAELSSADLALLNKIRSMMNMRPLTHTEILK